MSYLFWLSEFSIYCCVKNHQEIREKSYNTIVWSSSSYSRIQKRSEGVVECEQKTKKMKECCLRYVIRFLRIITILLLLVVARSSPQFLYCCCIIIIITAPMEKTLESAQLDHVIIFKPTQELFRSSPFSIPSFPLYKFLWLFFSWWYTL